MPLMSDWSDALCTALDEEERGLAAACQLKPGMDGPEFEANLGLLLAFDQTRALIDQFKSLGAPNFREERPAIGKARELTDRRITALKKAIDTTLYDQFGLHQVDDEKAATAYEQLLSVNGRKELALATTNYDRAGEVALAALDFDVDTGFRASLGRTPRLDPVGLVEHRSEKTPIIHLHGAVGWYEKDGAIEDHYADKPYNPSLGAPVVLYPDPDKDPTKDVAVSQLWAEFDKAVDAAEVVVVVGHSLHDPSLVRALRSASLKKPVVIGYFDTQDKERIESTLPKALALHLDFGPGLKIPNALKKAIT